MPTTMSRLAFPRIVALAVAALASVIVSAPVMGQDYKIVVNTANSTAELTSDMASKVFLKQVPKFPNGTVAQPVDQGKASPARVAFTRAVLGRAVGAVESYWQQQIFSGKDVPPPTKSTDDDVLAFVKANPGAIGYVSGASSVAGVKVVTVR